MSDTFGTSRRRHLALGWAIRFFLSLVVAVLGIVALVYFNQHSMLYHPRPYSSRYANSLLPDGVELPFEASFGKQVAFYLPRGLGAQLPARIWVAFCGNGSLALDWTGLIAKDHRAGDAFLLIDYPGFGKSEGYATIASTRAVAEGALDALAKHLGTTKGNLEPLICVLGHSWGTAVALDFATRHNVHRIVLIAVFTSLREEAALVVGGPLSHLLSENYDNRDCLRQISERSPPPRVDIFHGTKDDIIPVQMGRELADSFPAFIRFHPVKDGDHLSPLFTATDRILAAMNE